jgi:Mg-chelatase subunit ChlD
MESKKVLPNIKEIVSLKLRTLYQKISEEDYKAAKNGKIKMPMVLSVATEDVEDENFRQGLDLILTVDISGSMKGEKIKLVKETLNFVIDELDERDRISILTFNSKVNKLCGLKVMSKENKISLKNVIKDKLKPKGCTNIRKAMETSFNVLLERNEANDSTAIFLISDGQDTCGNNIEHIRKSMDVKVDKMKNKGYDFQVHSFGYGDDHDENVLDMISTASNGKFYFIKTLSFIDECFIDCFGYLMSNFAKNIELEIHLSNGIKFESTVLKSFEIKTDRVAIINVAGLATGKVLDYTAEISIDIKKNPFKLGKKVKIGKVDLNFESGADQYSFENELALDSVATNKEKGDADVEVEENFVKFEALRIMEESKKKLEQGKQKESKWMMNDFLGKLAGSSSLGVRFKKKIQNKMSYNNIVNNKCYTQVKHVFSNNIYNRDFSDAEECDEGVYNYRQRQMFERKKK